MHYAKFYFGKEEGADRKEHYAIIVGRTYCSAEYDAKGNRYLFIDDTTDFFLDLMNDDSNGYAMGNGFELNRLEQRLERISKLEQACVEKFAGCIYMKLTARGMILVPPYCSN